MDINQADLRIFKDEIKFEEDTFNIDVKQELEDELYSLNVINNIILETNAQREESNVLIKQESNIIENIENKLSYSSRKLRRPKLRGSPLIEKHIKRQGIIICAVCGNLYTKQVEYFYHYSMHSLRNKKLCKTQFKRRDTSNLINLKEEVKHDIGIVENRVKEELVETKNCAQVNGVDYNCHVEVVFNLINVKRFFKYSYEEKIELKAKGRPLPDITIEKTSVSRGKSYTRKFSRDIYSRNDWICGCNKKNALYCFPCLLFGGDKAWTEVGVTDLEHLSLKIKRHENSKTHLHNCMEFALLGSTNITAQLDPAYWLNIQKHNENVSKNRYILSKIINCVKFCGAFELAHNESDTFENPGIFRGLINFSAELDATLSDNLKNYPVFKDTSTKEIQNDLLQCMLEVCHQKIIEEINESPFLAIMADETTDIAVKCQLVVIFRYVRDGEPIERFWNYVIPAKCDAETISKAILNIVDPLIENSPNKLIAQSYDGAAVMSGQRAGVQALIKKKYHFAHYVHCYAHQLNLFMSKAASANSHVRVFFGNLQDISCFFNNSPQKVDVLNKIVNRKIPTTSWNFNIRTVSENRDSLIKCMYEIEKEFTNNTVCSAAASIRRTLNDPIFNFWLNFFHHLTPIVDILFNQLQQRKIEPNQVKDSMENFERSIIQVRNNIDQIISEALDLISNESPPLEMSPPPVKRGRFDYRKSALEVCDVILNCAKDRFNFKEHLVVASLFFPEKFGEYCGKFPDEKLTSVCSYYPTLDKERLRTELSVIYSRNDCRKINGAVPLLKFLIKNNLGDTLKETRKLLEIVITTPMTTSESERCFSTLNRIKTFLRNSTTEDRSTLTALSMLFIEKKFISDIDNFNEKVITTFANRKELGIDLIYKK